MKKLLLLALLLCGISQAWAAEWTDSNGINWTFTVSGTNATDIKPSDRSTISGAVTIPSEVNGYTVTSIGDDAFRGCSGLTSVYIQEGITVIGDCSFKDCTKLESITIPSTVSTVEYGAFNGCTELNYIECRAATPPNGYVDADEQMFSTYNTATLLVPPVSRNAYRNAEGWSLFQNIESIPCWRSYWTDENGVTWGFYNSTIYSCSNATGEVIVPNKVYYGGVEVMITSMGGDGFDVSNPQYMQWNNCSGVTSIVVPEGINEIGMCTIYNNMMGEDTNIINALPNLKSITLPSTFCLGDPIWYVFDIPNLQEIIISPNHPHYSSGTNNDAIYFIKDNGSISLEIGFNNTVIQEGTCSLDDDAFSGCTGLTSIVIPASVTYIGDCVFEGCSSLSKIYCKSPTPPDAPQEAPFSASTYTSATLYVPTGCKAAYRSAETWSKFTHVLEFDPDAIWTFTVSGTNATITGCTEPTGTLTIPSQVVKNGTVYNVTAIGSKAFQDCTGIESVVMSDGLKTIGTLAFSNCSGLTDIVIPSSVTTIGKQAFLGCSSLKSVTLPESLNTIGGHAFRDCSSLTSLTLPESLTSIGERGFYGCSKLSSLTIGQNVTSIGEGAFWGCSKLNSVQVVISDAAAFCSNQVMGLINTRSSRPVKLVNTEGQAITSFSVPDAVDAIGVNAFINATGLTSVTIPSGVTAIGDNAFSGCSSLTTVNCDITTPLVITENTFTNRSNAVLYVPAGCRAAYVNAEYWSDFKNILVVGAEALVEEIILDNNSLSLLLGEEATLSVSVLPDDAMNPEVEWTTSDPVVATVENGEVTAVGIGTATITVTAVDGSGVSATCEVTVTASTEADTDYSTIDNTIYLERTEGKTGGQVTLSVKMKNTVEVQGFQFDLYLPEGVTVATDEEGFPMAQLSTVRTTKQKTDYFDSSFRPDGSLRVLCGSTKGYVFDGEDGEVALITLNISSDMEEGDYPLILKEVSVSDLNSVSYNTDYLKSTLNLSSYTLGDVNGDCKINVSDFIAVANHILGRTTTTTFIVKAADVNFDNNINVSDFIGIANMILRGTTTSGANSAVMSAPRRADGVSPTDIDALGNALYIAPVTVAPGKQAVLSLRMKNKVPVAGFEFNLRLPEGVTVAVDGDGKPMAELSEERTTERKTNFFGSALQADGTLKVLCGTSAGDQGGLCSFNGNEGEVARITVNIPADFAEGDYLVTVANGVLSDVNAATIYLKPELAISNAYLSVHNSASGIDYAPITLDNAPSGVYYTLDGMKLNGKPSKRGVYVVNGKKVVVK